jgi:hypothetical protein
MARRTLFLLGFKTRLIHTGVGVWSIYLLSTIYYLFWDTPGECCVDEEVEKSCR